MKKLITIAFLLAITGISFASTYTAIGTISPGTRARSSTINDLNSNIATAFALLPDETELAIGTFNAALDTGTANTYLVSLPTTPAAYVDNMAVVMIPLNTNTGASTINVDSLGVVAIKLQDGSSALSAGDIVVGVPVEMRYSSVTGFFHINQAPAISGAVFESDFDATTFLYATSDNTPQPKTPAEVRVILDVNPAPAIYDKVTSATLSATDVSGLNTLTNYGSSGEVVLTWLTLANGQEAEFYVEAAQYLQIKAPAGKKIRIGTIQTAAAGYIRSNVVGNWVRVKAIRSELIVTAHGGTWKYDE
jgi:hypothetical protein